MPSAPHLRLALNREILDVACATPAVSLNRASQICSTAGRELCEAIPAPTPHNQAAKPGTGEAGFTLVLFVVAIAIMAIMMGVAVQSVSFQMQREKEAELIFRGEQYVEAIRLYKKRFGRNPMRLKELWEAKNPRVLRKKWKDPITDSEVWGVVILGQGTRSLAPGLPTPTPTPNDGGGRSGREGEAETIGPITGVYSRSCDESIRTYEGRTTYCEWKFVLDEGQAGNTNNQPR